MTRRKHLLSSVSFVHWQALWWPSTIILIRTFLDVSLGADYCQRSSCLIPPDRACLLIPLVCWLTTGPCPRTRLFLPSDIFGNPYLKGRPPTLVETSVLAALSYNLLRRTATDITDNLLLSPIVVENANGIIIHPYWCQPLGTRIF